MGRRELNVGLKLAVLPNGGVYDAADELRGFRFAGPTHPLWLAVLPRVGKPWPEPEVESFPRAKQ